MSLKDYFASNKGTGILSTADEVGVVNSAVYATPHCMDDGTVAFIMRERRTHENMEKNPYACYLFIEQGKMEGKRIYLTKLREEKNSELLFSLRRRCPKEEQEDAENLYLVFFRVDKILPLIGYGGL